MKVKMYTFEPHGDARGQLVAIEANKDIPFEVKRVYYMYDTTPGVARGHHAHKALEQILICVHGSCKILLDNGKEKETVVLDEPNKGLYISSDMWRVMYDFSPDAVLMVMASTYYEESDYIRDYDEFLKYVESRGE